MTIFENVVRIVGSLGTWALVLVWWFVGRDMNKRLYKVEDHIGTFAKYLHYRFDDEREQELTIATEQAPPPKDSTHRTGAAK